MNREITNMKLRIEIGKALEHKIFTNNQVLNEVLRLIKENRHMEYMLLNKYKSIQDFERDKERLGL